jgi:hypothetical protein
LQLAQRHAARLRKTVATREQEVQVRAEIVADARETLAQAEQALVQAREELGRAELGMVQLHGESVGAATDSDARRFWAELLVRSGGADTFLLELQQAAVRLAGDPGGAPGPATGAGAPHDAAGFGRAIRPGIFNEKKGIFNDNRVCHFLPPY